MHEARIRAGLEAALDALALMEREIAAAGWRGVAIAAGLALEGACVAALSAYDTAEPDAILHPDQKADRPDRLAPPQTLLRRVASPTYLDTPDRLALSRAEDRDLAALITLRNRAVHVVTEPGPADFRTVLELLPTLLNALSHLCVDHPAFPGARWDADRQRIAEALTRIKSARSTALR